MKRNRVILSMFISLSLVFSIILFYMYYSVGRYTLKPGDKQELHLKAGEGIDPLIYLDIDSLEGESVKLTGRKIWVEVIQNKDTQLRFYDTQKNTVSFFNQSGDEVVSQNVDGPITVHNDGITIKSDKKVSLRLDGKKDSTIYFENISDKTISFKVDLTYR